jgi:protein TonB
MALTAQAEEQQGAKRTVVMIIVIGIHVLGFWALQSGLARRLVEILPNDIKADILKDQKKEEPPPPPPPPPPDQAPPPPFVPPVEIAIAIPMEAPANAITTTTEKPPVTLPPIKAPQPDVVVKPQFKSRPADIEDYYPSAAKRDGQQGSVVIEVAIGADGKIQDAKVATSSGFPLLDEAAVKYAKSWPRMTPGTRNGVPSAMSFSIKVTFKLKEAK